MLIKVKGSKYTTEERNLHAKLDVGAATNKTQLAEWPVCARCNRPVRAYGYEETKNYVEVWAECGHGQKLLRERSKVTVKKPREDMKQFPGGIGNWLRRHMRLMVFFAPGAK